MSDEQVVTSIIIVGCIITISVFILLCSLSKK